MRRRRPGAGLPRGTFGKLGVTIVAAIRLGGALPSLDFHGPELS